MDDKILKEILEQYNIEDIAKLMGYDVEVEVLDIVDECLINVIGYLEIIKLTREVR